MSTLCFSERHRRSLLRLGGLALAVFAGIRPAAAQSYSVQDLGTLGGDTVATAINNAGEIVGWSVGPDGVRHAFRYSGGRMQDLGSPASPSEAWDINSASLVAGYTTGVGGPQATLWSDRSGAQRLAGSASWTTGVNASGQACGIFFNGQGLLRGFLWGGGAPTDLSALGGMQSEAWGLNDAGQVVGWADLLPLVHSPRAFLYSGGQMQNLGTLGGLWSWAYGINSAGQVVGWSENASLLKRAFLWQNGVMQELGTLGGGFSEAHAINNKGQIVGTVSIGSSSSQPFLYENGVMKPLDAMIPAGSGWELEQGNDINDQGQIVGSGQHNGLRRAFLLTLLPPPVRLASLTLTPQRVTGCKNATGTLTLDAPAPSAGATVALTTDAPLVVPPTTVSIPAGARSNTFSVATNAVSATVQVMLTATYRGDSKNAALIVQPIGVESVAVDLPSVLGGSSVSGTVTLECPAGPDDITVTLASNSPAATPAPATIGIPRGAVRGTFTVNTQAVTASTPVTIAAAANGSSVSVTLTVEPAPERMLPFGTAVCDKLQPGELDKYLLSAQPNDSILVRMARRTGGFYPQICLLDRDGNNVFDCSTTRNSITADVTMLVHLPSTGAPFTVVLGDGSRQALGGDYCVFAQRLNAPENALSLDAEPTRSGQIEPPAFMATFVFTGTQGSTSILKLARTSGGFAPQICLFDKDGKPVGDCVTTQYGFMADITRMDRLPSSGRYTVLVGDGSRSAATGAFTTSLTLVGE